MAQQQMVLSTEQQASLAIADKINRTLIPRGMSAKAALRAGSLHIRIEGTQVPDQELLSAFVQLTVLKLNPRSTDTLIIYGFQTGKSQPAWSQKILLKTLPQCVSDSFSQSPSSSSKQIRKIVQAIDALSSVPRLKLAKPARTRRIVTVIHQQNMLKQVLTGAAVTIVGCLVTTTLISWLDSVDKRSSQWQRSSSELPRHEPTLLTTVHSLSSDC